MWGRPPGVYLLWLVMLCMTVGEIFRIPATAVGGSHGQEGRVSNQALTILLTSIGAILVATVGAVIGAAVNSRAKIDEGLREQRLQVYPQLWAHTSIVSRWPRTGATWRDLAAVVLR
jgi:hypothetical protein